MLISDFEWEFLVSQLSVVKLQQLTKLKVPFVLFIPASVFSFAPSSKLLSARRSILLGEQKVKASSLFL